MISLNKIDIIGNLGSEPELRFTSSGKPVASFSVATNRSYTKDSEKKTDTEWFTVVTWNRLAENCNQYLTKGQLVYVSGRVALNKWEKKDGGQASRMEIIAYNVIFLSNQKNESTSEASELEPEDLPF